MVRFRFVFQRLRGLDINTTLKKTAMTAMQTVMAVFFKIYVSDKLIQTSPLPTDLYYSSYYSLLLKRMS